MIVKNWMINQKSDKVELVGLYQGKRNFVVHATLATSAVWFDNPKMGIIWDNPRGVKIPNYVRREVFKALTFGAKYLRITKLHKNCAMSLWLDIEKSQKSERAVYSYSVQTPEFEVWRFNDDTKEYDIETYAPILFEGDNFSPPKNIIDNQTAMLDDLLGWLTLSPGDTDKSYFSAYTSEQLAWTQSAECCDIKCALYA